MLAAVGYFVGASFTSSEAATSLMSVSLPVMLMLSGVILPLDMLPHAQGLTRISYFIPLTYLGDALRQELAGSGPHIPLWVDHLVILATIIVLTHFAIRSFRWDQDETIFAPPRRYKSRASHSLTP